MLGDMLKNGFGSVDTRNERTLGVLACRASAFLWVTGFLALVVVLDRATGFFVVVGMAFLNLNSTSSMADYRL